MTLHDIRDTIRGPAAVWWKCRGFSYFFLLILFHPSLPKKKIYYIFFSLFPLCQVELFHPNLTAQAHMSLLSSFLYFFFKIPHNKNVSLILILLLRQSKPSLLGMSYKSQKSSDSLGQRLYLKHLLCGRSRLNTGQVARGAVRGPDQRCHHPAGQPHAARPGSASVPSASLTQGHLPPADWDEPTLWTWRSLNTFVWWPKMKWPLKGDRRCPKACRGHGMQKRKRQKTGKDEKGTNQKGNERNRPSQSTRTSFHGSSSAPDRAWNFKWLQIERLVGNRFGLHW